VNIFVLDSNPSIAASMACLSHVCKQIVESAQMLSNCWTEDKAFYRRTHYNHSCSKWARATQGNYQWLFDYGFFLTERYTNVYGKIHKCAQYFKATYCLPNNLLSETVERTPFVLCMPDKYKVNDPVQSYQNYYIGEKLSFSKWEDRESIPAWLNISPEDKYKFVRT